MRLSSSAGGEDPVSATLLRLLAWTGLVALVSVGCTTVKPWQRGRLADPCMTFDSDTARLAYETHWQEAREGSSGGFGVQSGGCGCK
jgi:hypothetical protein